MSSVRPPSHASKLAPRTGRSAHDLGRQLQLIASSARMRSVADWR